MLGLRVFAPGPELLAPGASLTGLVPIAAGILLNVAAVAAFRRRGTTTDPDRAPSVLVTEGVYRCTRNPMYLGGVFILIGLGVLLAATTPFAVPPLYLVLADRRFVTADERALALGFPEAWAAYRARVRRWL